MNVRCAAPTIFGALRLRLTAKASARVGGHSGCIFTARQRSSHVRTRVCDRLTACDSLSFIENGIDKKCASIFLTNPFRYFSTMLRLLAVSLVLGWLGGSASGSPVAPRQYTVAITTSSTDVFNHTDTSSYDRAGQYLLLFPAFVSSLLPPLLPRPEMH